MDKPVNNKEQYIVDLEDKIEECYQTENEIWHGLLKLVITLSSSLLILTIALVEKMFNTNNAEVGETIPPFLIFSWVSFFIAIVFGIVAFINEVIFFSNACVDTTTELSNYIKLKHEGKNKKYTPEEPSVLFIQNDIIWGCITIVSFVMAVLFLCLALLEKVLCLGICIVILILGIIFLIVMARYLLKKRKVVRDK